MFRTAEHTSELEVVIGFVDAMVQSASATELCRNIVHASFSGNNTIGCQILWLDQSANLKAVASYGATAEFADLSAWGDSPPARAIRSKTVLFENAPPRRSGDGGADIGPKSTQPSESWAAVTVPYLRGGTPVGCMVVTLKDDSGTVLVTEELTKAISSLGAYYLDSMGITAGRGLIETNGSANPEEDLTERQKTVLKLMADGFTNAEIARELLLSESSIRQETVRIYKVLGVGSRQEAAKKGKALGLIART
jgi:DNA-binding CsgD family transcriptional regulator